jgi:hypothetical protein
MRNRGVWQTRLGASPIQVDRKSYDNETTINVTFAFEGGKKRLFWQWYKEATDGGAKPFNIELNVEGGSVTQEVRFAHDGMPQMTSKNGGIYSYSARLICRKLKQV